MLMIKPEDKQMVEHLSHIKTPMQKQFEKAFSKKIVTDLNFAISYLDLRWVRK